MPGPEGTQADFRAPRAEKIDDTPTAEQVLTEGFVSVAYKKVKEGDEVFITVKNPIKVLGQDSLRFIGIVDVKFAANKKKNRESGLFIRPSKGPGVGGTVPINEDNIESILIKKPPKTEKET